MKRPSLQTASFFLPSAKKGWPRKALIIHENTNTVKQVTDCTDLPTGRQVNTDQDSGRWEIITGSKWPNESIQHV